MTQLFNSALSCALMSLVLLAVACLVVERAPRSRFVPFLLWGSGVLAGQAITSVIITRGLGGLP
jgi:hypothetical protein